MEENTENPVVNVATAWEILTVAQQRRAERVGSRLIQSESRQSETHTESVDWERIRTVNK